MVTMSPIEPEVRVLVTYPLTNNHIFVNVTGTSDIIRAADLNLYTRSGNMVKTAGSNISTGSRLYIMNNPADGPSFNVVVGGFSSFDLDDNTATFALFYRHAEPDDKKVIEDIISNPNDYELFAKLSVRITKNGNVEFNKSGKSFFYLKNKRYIISKELKLTTDGLHKSSMIWKERQYGYNGTNKA